MKSKTSASLAFSSTGERESGEQIFKVFTIKLDFSFLTHRLEIPFHERCIVCLFQLLFLRLVIRPRAKGPESERTTTWTKKSNVVLFQNVFLPTMQNRSDIRPKQRLINYPFPFAAHLKQSVIDLEFTHINIYLS